jgi:hypothetical protein
VFKGETGDPLNPKGGQPVSLASNTGDATADAASVAVAGGAVGGNYTNPGNDKFPANPTIGRLAGIAVNQFHLTITATTNGAHVPTSLHPSGRAFDARGSKADMCAYANYIAQNPTTVTELIHNSSCFNIDHCIKNGQYVNGRVVFVEVWSGHTDHVHTAV